MTDPLVTVVMATKNASRFLREALDSIMAQTYTSHEVVVVDAGSTDGTGEIARSYANVRTIQQVGEGFAGAWNEGIDVATGDLIAFLDSDDRWTPNKLRVQVDCLAGQPDAVGVVAHVKFFMAPGQATPYGFNPELLDGDYVAHMPGALLARKELFGIVGRFEATWKVASDIDWFARLKDSGRRTVVIPEVLIHKRIHDSNLSYGAATTTVINDEILQLLRRSIVRQRTPAPR